MRSPLYVVTTTETGEPVVKYRDGAEVRVGGKETHARMPGGKWQRVNVHAPVAATGATVPPTRQSARAPRSRRATTRSRSRSPGRSSRADDGDDPDPERDELVALLAGLNCLCSEALDRDDMQSAIDAASAGWAEGFVFAWLRVDLDRLCPRCLSEWTIHPRSGQRWCDFCHLKVLLAGRVAS